MSDQSVYFATKEAKEAASILIGKSTSYFNLLTSNAYLEKLSKMWRAYHGNYHNDLGYGHQVSFTGVQGELVDLPVNHFRNLAQHIYVMITANRPVMEARALNTDYKSLAQTYLAGGILEYYMREKRLEDCLKLAVEYAIVLGAGFIKLEWNATAGEAYDYDEETQQFNYEGDLEFSNLSPFDVIVDGTKETWDHDWIMVRSWKNRFDLMAKYPEYSDKIKSVPPKNQSQVYRLAIWSNDDTDDVPVYEFYHKRTEALPEGRYLMFLESDVVLLDAKLPYRTIPIFRIAPSNIMGTPYGYSPMFDIFPLQEMINASYSSIATNQNAFMVQSLYVPRGADLDVNTLGEGMTIYEGNAKPEALQLTETPAEAFKFLEMLIQTAETISGVNSVARGNPEASLKSGTALALVQSMALQFMSGLQQSYVKLIEDVGSSVIQILKDFANAPRVVAIVGKNNRPYLKEFNGEQISSINRVIVDVGNPLSRTIAGRVQMAEQLLQMKLLKSPEQYFQVLNTGRLDSMYEGEMSELLLIKSENEQMLDNIQPLVSPMDKHSLHMNEHASVLADPDLRSDPNLVKVVMNHIEEHLNALRNTDPALLQLRGETPLPPLPPPGPPAPNGPQQGAPMPPGGPQPPMGALKHSPNGHIMGQNPATLPGGNQITGPGVDGQTLPNLPHPPAPFNHLPVQASDVAPR